MGVLLSCYRQGNLRASSDHDSEARFFVGPGRGSDGMEKGHEEYSGEQTSQDGRSGGEDGKSCSGDMNHACQCYDEMGSDIHPMTT